MAVPRGEKLQGKRIINFSILLYEEDDATYIVHIRKFFNLEHIPVHLFTNGVPSAENEYVLCQKLEDFFNNRMIPNSRSQFKEMLSELELDSSEGLARKSFFLSLSDNGICDWYTNFLAPLRRVTQDKKNALVKKLAERIEEKKSLCNIDDSFKKIVITKNNLKPAVDEKGIVTVDLFDFLCGAYTLSA